MDLRPLAFRANPTSDSPPFRPSRISPDVPHIFNSAREKFVEKYVEKNCGKKMWKSMDKFVETCVEKYGIYFVDYGMLAIYK